MILGKRCAVEVVINWSGAIDRFGFVQTERDRLFSPTHSSTRTMTVNSFLPATFSVSVGCSQPMRSRLKRRSQEYSILDPG